MTRKGSEVLLAIEEQNQEILGYVRSIDLKFSKVLNILNLQEEVKVTSTASPEPASLPEPKPAPAIAEPSVETPEQESNTRSVRQQIVYAVDEKPVPIAKVKIYTQQGELIKETRTGPSGKWQADLVTGQSYRVTVEKSKVRKYPLVKLQSDFLVQAGSNPQIIQRLEVS